MTDTDSTDAERLAPEAENLAQQLIDGAKRDGADTYTKTLLWHASDLIDRQAAALAEKEQELQEVRESRAHWRNEARRFEGLSIRYRHERRAC